MPVPIHVLRRTVPGLIVVAALVACGNPPPPQAPPAPPPTEVGVVTLRPQLVTLTRELPGRVNPFVVAEVRPQVGGIVKARLFDEGGRVAAGQALYQLDDSIPRADQATARAALVRAKAALESARPRAERWAELAKSGMVSKQDNENAIAALRQAEADVAAAEAVLARADVVVAHSRITSPIGGRIGKSAVTQGALVTANQDDALATVQQLDPVYVDVAQSSAELLELRRQLAAGTLEPVKDLPVTIVLEDGVRYAHEGRLKFADVTVDPGTGSYLLRVVVPNPDNVLLPGMYVRAVVGNAVRPDAILAPQRAIARDPKGNTSAMVVGADGKVEARPVVVSRALGDQWLVDNGLAAGDRVIVEGLQKIRPGAPVKAVEAEPAAQPRTAQAAAKTPGAGAGAATTPAAGEQSATKR